ncbi:MAG: hypothetical protein HYR76_10940, partial [Ignavibacteria bacterium]|nr:hypothetical protein [Ignavibacteria bacterium]
MDENNVFISGTQTTTIPIENHTYTAKFSTKVAVTLKNEFKDPNNVISNGGIINIDFVDKNTDLTGGKFDTTYGKNEQHRFEAKEQTRGAYYRGFNNLSNHDGGWVCPDSTRYFPVISTPVQAGTYTAKYRNRYDVSATTATYIEAGSGGTYNVNGTNVGAMWSGNVWQYESITLEAVPPSGFNFLVWSDGNQTNPRTLTPTVHTTLYAVFKQPLKSNTATALSSNAQRKLAKTTPPTPSQSSLAAPFMLYESSGSSFLSRKDILDEWEPEISIGGVPTATSFSRNPTLVLDDVGVNVGVVYDEVNTTTSTHTIQYDAYDGSTGSPPLFPILTIDQMNGSSDYQPMTSAAWTPHGNTKPSMFSATWRKDNSLYFGLGSWVNGFPFQQLSWSTPIDLNTVAPGAFNGATNPAMLTAIYPPATTQVPQFYVVWEDPNPTTGGIKLIRGGYNNSTWPPQASIVGWSPGQTIAANTPTETNSKPTIAIDGSTNVMIAWEYRNTSNASNPIGEIRARLFQPADILGPMQSVVSGSGSSLPSVPSIADYRNSTSKQNDFTLVWYTNQGTAVAHYTGGGWGMPYYVDPNGRSVSIQSSLNGSEDTRSIVYIGSSGPPYTINTKLIPPPTTLSSAVTIGWNMTSVPAGMYNLGFWNVYPTHVPGSYAFSAHGGNYVEEDPLTIRSGYWVKFVKDTTANYTGGPLDKLTINLAAGWNMVGTISNLVQTSGVSTSPAG